MSWKHDHRVSIRVVLEPGADIRVRADHGVRYDHESAPEQCHISVWLYVSEDEAASFTRVTVPGKQEPRFEGEKRMRRSRRLSVELPVFG